VTESGAQSRAEIHSKSDNHSNPTKSKASLGQSNFQTAGSTSQPIDSFGWDVILFDLDGTLTDSAQGVINGVLHACEQLGIEPPEFDVIQKFLGPPLSHSFREYAGVEASKITDAVRIYREYYDEIGKYENSVFEGIPELLIELGNRGKRLAVATSKVDYAAVSILEHFNLDHHFDVIAGADVTGEFRGTKAGVIAHALAELRMCDGTSVVMIGDREHDIHGAQAHDLPSIGVTWGYGSREELETSEATHIVESLAALVDLLLPNESA
jgi:phosphoglycolate phosphatase